MAVQSKAKSICKDPVVERTEQVRRTKVSGFDVKLLRVAGSKIGRGDW